MSPTFIEPSTIPRNYFNGVAARAERGSLASDGFLSKLTKGYICVAISSVAIVDHPPATKRI